jgi:hypothetical protein
LYYIEGISVALALWHYGGSESPDRWLKQLFSHFMTPL